MTDEERARCLALADRLEQVSGCGPVGFVDPLPEVTRTVRCKAAIDAAIASLLACGSVTDEEIDGVLGAGAMEYAADLAGQPTLPDAPAWLAVRGGITEAAKRLTAIVAELGPCTRAAVFARIGNALGEREWGRFLDEAIAAGVVLRTSDERLVALRRTA